jgi:hypothetical protein
MKVPLKWWRGFSTTTTRRLAAAAGILVTGVLAGAFLLQAAKPVVARGPIDSNKDALPAASVNSPVAAVTDDAGSVEAPGATSGLVDSYWRITGNMFHPTNSASTYAYDMSSAGCMVAPVPVTAFNAPFNLPTGAVIKRIDVYYRNSVASSSQHGYAFLQPFTGQGSLGDSILAQTRSGSQTGVGYFSDSSSPVSVLVNNATNAWVLGWWPGGTDQSICGIRVYYAGPPGFATFLPDMQK